MSRGGVHATGHGRRARALGATLLALLAAVALVACGSSGKGLIPSASAGPLVGDFENVLQAAESGAGNCSPTEAALSKTEEDFRSLPATVDSGLRANLRQGIANLRERARELCAQQSTTSTHTTTTKTTTTTTTPKPATTPTTTTPPKTTTTPPETSTPPTSGGGTPAPGETPSGGAGGNGEEHSGGNEESSAGGAGAPESSK
ncbi:MAG TPA: hypothetical protein VMB91_10775 [Solirubrobacteraceae bacterium]|nr:hypothetical protein [Solirubrobacteraceae bacterium]